MENANRENIFTIFARDINAFCEHRMTKQDIYKSFVVLMEMADDSERIERQRFEKEMEEWNKKDLNEMMNSTRPYSNYELALDLL